MSKPAGQDDITSLAIQEAQRSFSSIKDRIEEIDVVTTEAARKLKELRALVWLRGDVGIPPLFKWENVRSCDIVSDAIGFLRQLDLDIEIMHEKAKALATGKGEGAEEKLEQPSLIPQLQPSVPPQPPTAVTNISMPQPPQSATQQILSGLSRLVHHEAVFSAAGPNRILREDLAVENEIDDLKQLLRVWNHWVDWYYPTVKFAEHLEEEGYLGEDLATLMKRDLFEANKFFSKYGANLSSGLVAVRSQLKEKWAQKHYVLVQNLLSLSMRQQQVVSGRAVTWPGGQRGAYKIIEP